MQNNQYDLKKIDFKTALEKAHQVVIEDIDLTKISVSTNRANLNDIYSEFTDEIMKRYSEPLKQQLFIELFKHSKE